jgi:hypothetical protein
MRDALREAWELAAARPPVHGQVRAYPLEASRDGARAAVSGEGHRGLLVPVRDGEAASTPSLKPGTGRVLNAEHAWFFDGADRLHALAVWCREPALNDVFSSFAEAFLERWTAGAEPGAAAEACHAEFRHLLAGPKAIDIADLVGLIGELLFLADLVGIAPEAIDSWCADSGERHDFRHGAHGVEVKTTLRSGAAGQIVHVSSMDQLDPPDGGVLYLHLVRLEQVAHGPLTLTGLVARISQVVGQLHAGRLRARVERIGGRAGELLTPSFALLERQTFWVNEEFPRLSLTKLSSRQLDAGVRAVNYDLDLNSCRRFTVDMREALAGLVPGGDQR